MAAKHKAISIMKTLGLQVHIDPFGNVIGGRKGKDLTLPPIMTGSHLDTVQNGGRFDGTTGVIGALETIHALNILEIPTSHPVEVIIFTSEEPNRFGFSAFGSKGLSAKWNFNELSMLKDENGTFLPLALKSLGIDWESLQKACRPPALHAFIEMHVEQGERLDKKRIPVGVVLGITGIYRQQIHVRGEANHSGTTTMARRKDALMAASEIILAAEQCVAPDEDENATATVGRIQVNPNQVNIIPGEVVLIVEFRSTLPEIMEKMKLRLKKALSEIGLRRRIDITTEEVLIQPPTRFSDKVIRSIRKAAHTLGFPTLDLFSMAGHDANHLASITDSGMVFIPSRGGHSHCPEEWTDAEDIAKGCMILLHSILYLDGEKR
jgi:N-carbamoyl-L-amino-acid hydrolase